MFSQDLDETKTQTEQLDNEGYDEDYVPSGYVLGTNPLDKQGNILPLHKIFDGLVTRTIPYSFDLPNNQN